MQLKNTTLTLVALLIFSSIDARNYVSKSDLIYEVLSRIETQYVDPNRIKPIKMLEGALENLSVELAPVITTFKEDGHKVMIHIRVDQANKTYVFNRLNTILDLEKALQKVVQYIKKSLDPDEKVEMVDYGAINGFLKVLDPHSILLPPQIYSDFSTEVRGEFVGVGMMIGLAKGNLTVIAPMSGTPASRAGLRSKDWIVQIDEESTVNMSLSDAVNHLRGKRGTAVDIYILRESFTEPKKFTIIRDVIKITSVEFHLFEEDKKRVGYIKIKRFQKNTMSEFNQALSKLNYDLSDFHGLILDLRDNPGGLLDQAIRISDRFITDGIIVSTVGIDPASNIEIRAHFFSTIKNTPIIVIVNNGSASASEIVSAALKNHKRAIVIGSQTFGKGSVQQVHKFRDGSALKITTSKYLTPGSISIQSVGVTPDIKIVPYYVTKDYFRVSPPKDRFAEAKLSNNFSEWGDKQVKPLRLLHYLYDESSTKDDDVEDRIIKPNSADERLVNNDYLINLAKRILNKKKIKDYQELKSTTLNFLKVEEISQIKRLATKLKIFDVSWEKKSPTNNISLDVDIWIEMGERKKDSQKWSKIKGDIPAGSKIRLYVEAKNIGENTISQLIAKTSSKDGLFDDREFAFGTLKKDQNHLWYVPISIGKSIISRNSLVQFDFLNSEGNILLSRKMEIIVKEKERPSFSYEIIILDNGDLGSEGNDDSIVQVGEKIALKIKTTNHSNSDSNGLTFLLKNGEGKSVFLSRGRTSIEKLHAKASTYVNFAFVLKKIPQDDNIDLSLDILDREFPLNSINHKFKIPVGKKVSIIKNMAPKILVKNQKLKSNEKNIILNIRIFDDKGVKDAYIFTNNKKTYYKNFSRLAHKEEVNFETDISLEKNMNQITLISRDYDNVVSRKIIRVRNINSDSKQTSIILN